MRAYELIKCKRQALGLTQKEFAEIVGVSTGTISKFELGEQVSEVIFKVIKSEALFYFSNLD